MPLTHSISSPLEAGPSIFDGRSMPIYLSSALEYTSKKLARKAMHLTLVVVRRDYQLPSTTASPGVTSALITNTSASSTSPGMTANNRVMAGFSLSSIKRKVRGNASSTTQGLSTNNSIQERIVDMPNTEQVRNHMVSPAFSISSVSSLASTVSTASTVDSSVGSPRLGWPLTPATPATPYSEVSSTHTTTTDASSAIFGAGRLPAGLNPISVKLVHVSPLSAREERTLRHTMHRTERKFHLGPSWFPEAVTPSDCGLNADVIHRSLVQNEVLFSSKGLTLLALDHLYTFKSALASYSATQASSRLEDAVDELRRLVLGQGGRKLCRSVLESSFTWLGPVSKSALRDVTHMYRRAYGGISGESGVDSNVDGPLHSKKASTVHVDADASASPNSWPLSNRPVCVINTGVNEKPLPALPPETPTSQGPSESDESSTWDGEDLRSTTASSSAVDKRFAMIDIDFRFGFDFEVEDYYRLSHTRDLLTEREEAEAAAWAAAGSSGEAVDCADGVLVGGLAELAAATEGKVVHGPKSPGPLSSAAVEDFIPLALHLEESEQERTTSKITEKPRLQLQTPSSPLVISKPVALRMPALKLQTTFGHKQIIQKPVPVTPLNRRLTLSGAETTLNLVGMTPVEVRMPGFDRLLTEHHNNKPYLEEEDEELTARPISGHPSRSHRWTQRWDNLVSNSIDGRLASPVERRESLSGPSTPKGYDDISPITRGEWGFLFKGDTWQNGRTVAVEMC